MLYRPAARSTIHQKPELYLMMISRVPTLVLGMVLPRLLETMQRSYQRVPMKECIVVVFRQVVLRLAQSMPMLIEACRLRLVRFTQEGISISLADCRLMIMRIDLG